MTPQLQAHWDRVYKTKPTTEVSWYEERPTRSLDLIAASGIQKNEPVIDVGGGAAFLVDALLLAGYTDLTVLDISAEVIEQLRKRLGAAAQGVSLLREDVTTLKPSRRYALWHDRAVFHFLIEHEDRVRYVEALRRTLQPNGHLILATFGPQGPQRCSDLPVARYDSTTLAAEIGADFKLMDSSLVTHRTPRGTEQQFLYCRFVRSGE
jgi:SAM-dependent methyltransferase